jgi:hypothetical protein
VEFYRAVKNVSTMALATKPETGTKPSRPVYDVTINPVIDHDRTYSPLIHGRN